MMALRRISSLTGTDSHPDSRSWPRVAARDMPRSYRDGAGVFSSGSRAAIIEPVKYFAGLLAIVALVAGATVGGYHAWDRTTHTKDDNGGVLAGASTTLPADTPAPAEGQVFVTGKITTAHLDGVTLHPLPTPITVDTATRGQ